MPIDPQIARGYPGGIVNSFMEGERHRANMDDRDSINQRRNALVDIERQESQQAQITAQQQQALLKKYSDIQALKRLPPEAAAQWLEQQKAEPNFANTPWANAPAEQAIPAIEAQIATVLGLQPEQPKQAPSQAAEIQRFEYGQRNPAFREYEDRNRPRPGSGGGEGGNVNWQRTTKNLPDGTVQDVAFNPRTLEERPMSEPRKVESPTKPMSPKDANTARIKLTQVRVARQQLQEAQRKYGALKGTLSAGPGGNLIPSPKGKAYDAAIDTMRSSISALTRVPGIGAMSDFETRLDQAKFPTRGNYEAVGEQQLQALADQLDTIEGSYREMLGGGGTAAPAAAPQGDDFPPASENKGRKVRDTDTGKVFKSDGNSWIPQ